MERGNKDFNVWLVIAGIAAFIILAASLAILGIICYSIIQHIFTGHWGWDHIWRGVICGWVFGLLISWNAWKNGGVYERNS